MKTLIAVVFLFSSAPLRAAPAESLTCGNSKIRVVIASDDTDTRIQLDYVDWSESLKGTFPSRAPVDADGFRHVLLAGASSGYFLGKLKLENTDEHLLHLDGRLQLGKDSLPVLGTYLCH